MNRFRRGPAAPDPEQRAAGALVALAWLDTLPDPPVPAIGPALLASVESGSRPERLPLAARLAPVVIARRNDPEGAVEAAAGLAGPGQTADAFRYSAGLLLGLLHGVALKTALAPLFEPSRGLWQRQPLSPAVLAAAGSGAGPAAAATPDTVAAILAARTRLRRRHAFPAGELGGWLEEDGLEAAALIALLAGTAFGEESVPPFDEELRRRLTDACREMMVF